MLEDPTGPYGRWLAPGLIELEERQDTRCLVLLGDPGSGKSDELDRESARWHDRGVPVLPIDLGAAPDWSELRASILDARELTKWRTGAGELVLLLDGFDEAQATVRRLSEGLVASLGSLPLDRLRLRITGRPSIWPHRLTEHLQRLWPASFEVLVVAPLTAGDVRVSAQAALGDGEGFLGQVRSRGVGVFAARPITLDMLLIAAGDGPLPDDRVDLYGRAVGALAVESHERRVQDRADGPPVASRVAAAEILAIASLLAGTPRMVRRRGPSTGRGVLALDDVVTPPLTPSDLDGVWDSGLLTPGSSATLTWTHRSIAEFLCARRIVDLPPKTVRHLLSDPESVGEVVPQLAGVAVWAASMDADIFDWVAATEPALLLTPDLRTAPPARRRRIVQALLAELGEDHPPSDLRRYNLLDYPELADDIAPLLEPTQPNWIRREALRFLGDNNRRDHDALLMTLIEEVASRDQPDASDLGVAEVAALMLDKATDPSVVARAAAVGANPSAPTTLRSELISSFWSHYDLPRLLGILDRRLLSDRRSRLRELVSVQLSEALRSGGATPAVVIDWLCAISDAGLAHDAVAQVGGGVVLGLAARDDLDDRMWADLGRLCANQAHVDHDIAFWGPDDITLLGQDARRRLALETLLACQHPGDTLPLRASGLLADEDFEYWASQYGEALATGDDLREHAARNAVFLVARPTETNISIAARLVRDWPELGEWYEEWSSPAQVALWQQHQTLEATRLAEDSARQAVTRFSVTRLAAYVDAGAWPAVGGELRKAIEDEARGHVVGQPLSSAPAWKVLDRSLADAVTGLAAAHLASSPDTATTPGAASVGDAYALLAAVEPQRLVDLDPDTLLAWLPGLLELPGHIDTVRQVIGAISRARPQEVEAILLRGLCDDASASYAATTARLGAYSTPAVEDALAEAAEREVTDTWVLESMLAALMARDQDRATALALAVVSERPSSKPDRDVVDDGSDPAPRRWRRAVSAAVVLAHSPAVGTVFDDLLAQFEASPDFGLAVHSWSQSGGGAWTELSAEQLASLYLWIQTALSQPLAGQGGVLGAKQGHASGFSNDVFGMLRRRVDPEAATALERIATETNEPWARTAAAEVRNAIRSQTWTPLTVDQILQIVVDPDSRVVRSEAQLAEVLLDALDALAVEIRTNPDVRQIFWLRQLGSPLRFIPLAETEFSTRLADRLRPRVESVVLRQEVQLNHRFGAEEGAFPDIEAIVQLAGGGEVSVVCEVKGNWHDKVLVALEEQLVDRYLIGRTRTGIYIVAYYAGDLWDDTHSQKKQAGRHTHDELRATLEGEAARLSTPEQAVHVRVIDLTLNPADVSLDLVDLGELSPTTGTENASQEL